MTATKMTSVAAPMRNAISHSSRWSRIFTGPFSSRRCLPARWRHLHLYRRITAMPPGHDRWSVRSRLESRVLVHLSEDLLADARLVFLVNGHERFLHLRLLIGGQRDDLRFAALADRFERVVVFLLGDVVCVFGRVLH